MQFLGIRPFQIDPYIFICYMYSSYSTCIGSFVLGHHEFDMIYVQLLGFVVTYWYSYSVPPFPLGDVQEPRIFFMVKKAKFPSNLSRAVRNWEALFAPNLLTNTAPTFQVVSLWAAWPDQWDVSCPRRMPKFPLLTMIILHSCAQFNWNFKANFRVYLGWLRPSLGLV